MSNGKEPLVVVVQGSSVLGLLQGHMLPTQGSQGMWNIPPDPEFPLQFFPLIWGSRTFEVLSGELILDGPADLW